MTSGVRINFIVVISWFIFILLTLWASIGYAQPMTYEDRMAYAAAQALGPLSTMGRMSKANIEAKYRMQQQYQQLAQPDPYEIRQWIYTGPDGRQQICYGNAQFTNCN